MAGISQNLKAVITFGGNIDGSWNRSANSLQKSLNGVGKQSEKLTKDQAKLAAEIKRAKLAGESLSDLKRRYTNVSREIRKTEAEQQKLNSQMMKAQRLQAFKGAGKGMFRRGMGIASQLGGMVAPGMAIGGGGMVASALGTLIAPAATNAETAQRANVAKSYGVDAPTFNSWDSLAKQYDMRGENIGDLFEEYLHKAGEYKQTGKQSSLQDAFDTLGFKAGDLAGLSNMAQFDKIVERALSLKDDSKSSFALDALFGGETSKLLMLIKQSGRSYRDLMDEQRRYNLVTKEGAEGAIAGNKAVGDLRTVFSSAVAEISGQLGNQLAPDIRRLTDDLADWFKGGGIKRVVNFLKNDLYPGVLTFGQGIVFVGKVIYALAKKLSWLLPDDEENKKNILRDIATGGSVEMARFKAGNDGLGDWFAQKVDRPGIPEKLRNQWSDAEDNAGFWKSHLPGEFQQQTSQSLLESVDGKSSGNMLDDWDSTLKKNQQKTDDSLPVSDRVTEREEPYGPGDKMKDDRQNADGRWPVGDLRTKEEEQYGWESLLKKNRQKIDDKTPASATATEKNDPQAGYWETLLQRLSDADQKSSPRQLTDNRKFEYRFEINAAPGQSEQGIADGINALTKTSPAFRGDNSMLDGGLDW